ncbi:1,2-dihydroxy-3-keto-5-methylthiopentene dioxygenase [Malassezia brasiliensis]|uniref:1,2-dihydroxy-3-keto-5-methylthiopentene dioxygenase n=1 Tax=Malassezia brasiliensis TaxID=1821822 RepID=A0AAF0IPS5_9BASI|nr:1,2-dihydroxy-3-keto-5-methylthiopentene dioxygenase [Malassezia brasiliensis]
MASYSMNGANPNMGGTNGGNDPNRQEAPEYTLSGVLHFLQSEWRRYERDRNSWSIERAELRARIALLEGERRGVENVKNDLLRRIKMLEYALRQERFKNQANMPSPAAASAGGKPAAEKGPTNGISMSNTPQNEEANTAQTLQDAQRNGKNLGVPPSTQVKLPLGVKDSKGRAKSRAYLQQCLQEIAYLTSAATLNPLAGQAEETDAAVPVPPRPRLALLENAGATEEKEAPKVSAPSEEVTTAAPEPVPAKPAAPSEAPNAAAPVPLVAVETPTVEHKEPPLAVSTLSEAPDHTSSPVQPLTSVPDVQQWKLKCSIPAHFDSVRATVFDYNADRLYTASDDATIKHWSTKNETEGLSADLLTTLRGHEAGVTCLALSKERQFLYSGGLDATVRAWALPAPGETTEPSTSTVLATVPKAVWGLALFPYGGQDDALLGSVSADGLVRLWWTDSEKGERLHLSWDYFGSDPHNETLEERAQMDTLPVPTSITAVPASVRVCAVSFSNGVVKTFSLETGQELKRLVSGTLARPECVNKHANMVVAHPTLPLVATAQENSYIHMYDVMTGACTMSLHAHGDSVSCIDIDPSGLTLVSGSHDCTVRFWDIGSPESRDGAEQGALHASQSHSAVCFQEIRPHEVKANEGVLSVVYHASAPLVATSGADGVVRLFG